MKVKQILTLILALLLPITVLAAEKFDLQKEDVHDRMTYHRAIDAAVLSYLSKPFQKIRQAPRDFLGKFEFEFASIDASNCR